MGPANTKASPKTLSALESVCKCFVGIKVEVEHSPDKFTASWLSGFVVEIAGVWLYVTAAHVLDELIKAKNHPAHTIFTFYPFNVRNDSSTDFQLIESDWIVSDEIVERFAKDVDPETYKALKESDLAILFLSEYYVSHFKATGVVPIPYDHARQYSEQEIRDKLKPEYSADIYMVGIPSAKVENYEHGWHCKTVAAPVAWRQDGLINRRWIPRWTGERRDYDVTGSSGGPIILVGAFDHPYLMGVQISQKLGNTKDTKIYTSSSPYWFFELLHESFKFRQSNH